MRVPSVVAVGALLGACGRVSFSEVVGTGDGGIRPPVDSMLSGDTPDSAALFDCHMTHPTALFCDGFEGPMNETWNYQIVDNGRVEAATTRAYRGSRALEVESFGVDAYKSARWGVFLPQSVSSGDLYLRGYYWITSSTIATGQASILSSGNAVDPYPSTYLRLSPDSVVIQADANTFPFSTDLPRDRWFCLELHITVHPSAGLVTAAVDGTVVMTTDPGDTLVNTGYDNLDVGLHYATPDQGAVMMWIDEVIADTAPIGCN